MIQQPFPGSSYDPKRGAEQENRALNCLAAAEQPKLRAQLRAMALLAQFPADVDPFWTQCGH